MLTFCILGGSLASPLFLQLPPQDIGTGDENGKGQGDLDRGPAPRSYQDAVPRRRNIRRGIKPPVSGPGSESGTEGRVPFQDPKGDRSTSPKTSVILAPRLNSHPTMGTMAAWTAPLPGASSSDDRPIAVLSTTLYNCHNPPSLPEAREKAPEKERVDIGPAMPIRPAQGPRAFHLWKRNNSGSQRDSSDEKKLECEAFRNRKSRPSARVGSTERRSWQPVRGEAGVASGGLTGPSSLVQICCRTRQDLRSTSQFSQSLNIHSKAKMLNVSTLSSPYFLRQSSRELCVGENETVESGRLKTEERLSKEISSFLLLTLAVTGHSTTLCKPGLRGKCSVKYPACRFGKSADKFGMGAARPDGDARESG
ncbi:uncharacterized protein LOC120614706 [Pteropus medius]|uniref:uncharacterized protein LOC120614706 n=1 Tax=Pteropus vampyrus TaxID=132908 RepID=UPI00196B636E|nr:uncharacterized protein LOC120614706 [Pteropus giganteus]